MRQKLAANLTSQVRAIAKVTKAVAVGDLSQTIDVEAKGEILELKVTVNDMVLQLRTLADEVSRVSLEVGSQGKLGGQAVVEGVEGVWKEMTQNVSVAGSILSWLISDTPSSLPTSGQPDVYEPDGPGPVDCGRDNGCRQGESLVHRPRGCSAC